MFFKTYPCPPCAADFQKDLKINPPKLENRKEFANWMCEMHNRCIFIKKIKNNFFF